MTESAGASPPQGSWADVTYLSAIPDFRDAPDPMFNAPHGWQSPDPAWQARRPGWAPQYLSVPVYGYPAAEKRHELWLPQQEVRKLARRASLKRRSRYAFYSMLYPVGFAVTFSLLFIIFPPAVLFVLVIVLPFGIIGAIPSWLGMFFVLFLADRFYLRALRRGRTGRSLFLRTFLPSLTIGLTVLAASIAVVCITAGDYSIVMWITAVAMELFAVPVGIMLSHYVLHQFDITWVGKDGIQRP